DKISFNLDSVERQVFSNRTQRLVEDISRIQLEVINFRRIVKPLRPVIMSLERKNNKFLTENLEVYFDDITDQIEKIWDMLENFKEVVESVRATHESSMSHRINNLMKIFTVISVIIQPMILVSGLFSMNLKGIPFSNLSNSFWIIIGISSTPTVIIATTLLRRRKEWL
ncbi:MAG TPA: CorA family divalent cation transporter, partial [Verrucomicrobiae bacterium]|nr:CorA family divalent cation transporter [Verrucomicrobiae bacterium]